jgi:hypothetical protein
MLQSEWGVLATDEKILAKYYLSERVGQRSGYSCFNPEHGLFGY